MSIARRTIPLTIAAIVATGYFYFQQADKPITVEDTAVVPEEASEQQVTEDAIAETDEAIETSEPSPFEVVETESPETTEPVIEQQTTTAAISESVEPAETSAAADTAEAPPAKIVVPSSYSIEDAEKYFIPKDQRGPGNMGGPPPLNFPGGPNDKSLQLPQSDEG